MIQAMGLAKAEPRKPKAGTRKNGGQCPGDHLHHAGEMARNGKPMPWIRKRTILTSASGVEDGLDDQEHPGVGHDGGLVRRQEKLQQQISGHQQKQQGKDGGDAAQGWWRISGRL